MSKVLVMMVLIVVFLSGCEGQTETRVFVTNSAGTISAGYNACRTPGSIRKLRLADETKANESRTLWEVALSQGPGVASIPFGVVPKGYRVVTEYRAADVSESQHLALDIVGVDGYRGGLAGDFLKLSDKTLLWSKGVRKGTDLSGISKSTFGCG